jgi:hypothetical protein
MRHNTNKYFYKLLTLCELFISSQYGTGVLHYHFLDAANMISYTYIYRIKGSCIMIYWNWLRLGYAVCISGISVKWASAVLVFTGRDIALVTIFFFFFFLFLVSPPVMVYIRSDIKAKVADSSSTSVR